MSFSSNIKEELYPITEKARHCNASELSSIASQYEGFYTDENGDFGLKIQSENEALVKKCFTLLEKTFNIGSDILICGNIINNSHGSYILDVKGEDLRSLKNAKIYMNCCKRAYIRGAFLASGSMSDPNKSYHFEIVCSCEQEAEKLQGLINSFELDSKIVKRKKSYVVYLKEGSQISDLLTIMEASISMMKFENIRILKELRNTINRKVNCEAANINKTVSAAVRQTEDIIYIRDSIGFDDLPENLKDVALTRLKYPEASLKELANLLENPVGKSGVNHRLRKLSEMADKLRERKEENGL